MPFLTPGTARGQDAVPAEEPTLDDTIEAGEADAEDPRRELIRWNHYEGPYFTIRLGGGVLYEGAGYSQDKASEEQFPDLEPEGKVRDARFLLRGSLFPNRKRAITYSVGLMYDGPTDEFLARETGVMVEVPELWGHLFIGRTKEGFSLNKVMSGFSGWTMERSTINDATIPILADGIKWLGYLPKQRILWNLGVYGDFFSEGQGFSTYDNQVVGRLAWVPIADEATKTLWHVGMSARYGKPDDGQLRLRSRPETFPADYFVDTGTFAAKGTKMLAIESYYRPGPFLVGTEYFVQWADAEESGDPTFHGGDVVVTYLVTGETRKYNTRGGFFNSISPAQTVFEGGPGAWELVFRASYIDLDAGTLTGGKFWRAHADGQLASVRQPALRTRLRLRRTRPLRPRRRHPVSPESDSVHVLVGDEHREGIMKVAVRFLLALSFVLSSSSATWAASDAARTGTWRVAPTLRAVNSAGGLGRMPGTEGSAVTIFDSFTDAGLVTTTSNSPRTYMGTPFVAAGPGTIAHITEATVYLAPTGAFACSNGIDIRVQVWDGFDASAILAVFSDAVGGVETFTVPGPLVFGPLDFTPINLTFPVPRDLVDLTGGWVVSFRCDNGSGMVSLDEATSGIRADGPLTVGSFPPNSGPYNAPVYGYYRNVGGQTNFNHPGSDHRTISGLNDIGLALQLRGTLTPVELLSFGVE